MGRGLASRFIDPAWVSFWRAACISERGGTCKEFYMFQIPDHPGNPDNPANPVKLTSELHAAGGILCAQTPKRADILKRERCVMALNRFIMAVVFLVLTATVANAYTLVMRNGRQIEIPNEFTVTTSTLTYTVGSGIQITVQLSGIDIAKTERVNREPAGSFLARVLPPARVAAPPAQTPQRAQRSITNHDLEGYRRTRIESELAYDKRRKELGLSSAEDGRRQAAAITDRTYQRLLGMRDRDESAEQYWRDRASSLRSEETTTLAQIDYVRQRLAEIPSTNSLAAFTSPFGLASGPFMNFPFPNLNSGLHIGINTRQRNGRHRRFDRFGRGRGRFNDLFGGNLVALPYETYDYTYERAELVKQLDELQLRNAALRVRWRELEEDARRAGAYPGWLRP